MSFASFIDMIMVVVKFFLQVQNMSLSTPSSSASASASSAQWWIEFINEWRDLLTFVMPNVGTKRALFNLKIQTIPQCKLLLDAIEISTTTNTNAKNNRNATLELINKHKSLSSLSNNNNTSNSNNDWQSKGFDWQEPGIGKFLFMNFGFIFVSCVLIALIEMNVFDWMWSQLFNKLSKIFSCFKRKQQRLDQDIQLVISDFIF
jgi:hypothetical protein